MHLLMDNSFAFLQVASFPFDDHNCPPIHLIKSFCQSAYTWLKEDILNVVVVHCKAGKARTGLMICSLLLFLKVILEHWKLQTAASIPWLNNLLWFIIWWLLIHLQFFPTVEECIDYYNQKRCVDAKGLILPSQIVSQKSPYKSITQ